MAQSVVIRHGRISGGGVLTRANLARKKGKKIRDVWTVDTPLETKVMLDGRVCGVEIPPRQRRQSARQPSSWSEEDELGKREDGGWIGYLVGRALFVSNNDEEMSKGPIIRPRLMSRAPGKADGPVARSSEAVAPTDRGRSRDWRCGGASQMSVRSIRSMYEYLGKEINQSGRD
ncbi:hypothetical protein LX36DRAFT_351973 [Colletotrichum falcatum]|nr:hypothetical protein LX36DRAFT_351973 [Colletotrichum falcatum]